MLATATSAQSFTEFTIIILLFRNKSEKKGIVLTLISL